MKLYVGGWRVGVQAQGPKQLPIPLQRPCSHLVLTFPRETHREHWAPSGGNWYCKTGEQNFKRTIYTVDAGNFECIFVSFLIYFRDKDVSAYSF